MWKLSRESSYAKKRRTTRLDRFPKFRKKKTNESSLGRIQGTIGNRVGDLSRRKNVEFISPSVRWNTVNQHAKRKEIERNELPLKSFLLVCEKQKNRKTTTNCRSEISSAIRTERIAGGRVLIEAIGGTDRFPRVYERGYRGLWKATLELWIFSKIVTIVETPLEDAVLYCRSFRAWITRIHWLDSSHFPWKIESIKLLDWVNFEI